ncbi:hypothetical protein ARTHRO9V_10041 [Arthrobacter sp. 9V]|nr:hypothetical protein ARTHRO9V_10041 [Arthrobacter sp. 9V]
MLSKKVVAERGSQARTGEVESLKQKSSGVRYWGIRTPERPLSRGSRRPALITLRAGRRLRHHLE